ncbi:flagellar export protein FliJ [Pantoea sp. MBD-2R]|uniref:flagellar export protein FliJ n=1 Tax=Pantoea sp. MBD-2R TaxID=3141540 RepID=UPI00318335C9
MDKKVEKLDVLELLRQMRESELEAASGRLARQQQVCQRYSNTINKLTSLSAQGQRPESGEATLSEPIRFEAGIQCIIDWLKQEQPLAQIREEALAQEWVEQACREKSLSLILERQRAAQRQCREQWEQQRSDRQLTEIRLSRGRNGR